jgi:Na+/proline symporter
MHIIAATFLLPTGVVLYTFVGGIKATFLTDYFHTFVITVIICFFTIKAFLVPEIGSIGNLWNLIVEAGVRNPVEGNQDGSYLTMTSHGVGVLPDRARTGAAISD